MLRTIPGLLLLGLAHICRGQSPLDETRTFLAWYTQSAHLRPGTILVDSPSFHVMTDAMEKVAADTVDFSPAERKEIRRRMADPAVHTWDSTFVGSFHLLPTDSLKRFYRRYGEGRSYFFFSSPIFLRDYTLCIFYAGHDCGPLCGGGSLAVYRKVNGRWTLWKSFGEWVS